MKNKFYHTYGINDIKCGKSKFCNILDRGIGTKKSQRYVPFTNIQSQISVRTFSLKYSDYFGKLSNFPEVPR